jgi:hypothetical protein
MKTGTLSTLEQQIICFLENPEVGHNLPEIVKSLREFADDASIKAALHRLSAEGILQITPEWEFRAAAAAR